MYGYLAPMDDDHPVRRHQHRCGGWANPYGPCGATDCADCYDHQGADDDTDLLADE